MMAVLSRVPHCRPQLLPVELGTDMQHGQSMSAPPSEYHGGTSRRRRCSTTGLRDAHWASLLKGTLTGTHWVCLSTGRLTRCRVRERRWVRSARNKKWRFC